jgi:hypothetical protein
MTCYIFSRIFPYHIIEKVHIENIHKIGSFMLLTLYFTEINFVIRQNTYFFIPDYGLTRNSSTVISLIKFV